MKKRSKKYISIKKALKRMLASGGYPKNLTYKEWVKNNGGVYKPVAIGDSVTVTIKKQFETYRGVEVRIMGRGWVYGGYLLPKWEMVTELIDNEIANAKLN